MQMPPVLEGTSWIDIGALALVLALGVAGAIRGATRMIVGFLTMVVAFWMPARYGGTLGIAQWSLFAESDLEDPQRTGMLVECGLIFVAVLVVGAIVARLLRSLIESLALGGIDRLLAFFLGAGMGAIFAAAAVLGLMAVDHEALWNDMESSIAVHMTRRGVESGVSAGWIDGDLEEWLRSILSRRSV